MKSVISRIFAAIAVVSIIVNVLLFFRWSPSRPVVTVGQGIITKKDFQNRLEYEGGQAVLTKLVFASLVTQAATRAGVMPTTADVEDRVQSIRRRTPQLLAPYEQDPVKIELFKQDLATNMGLENLRIRDVALTPAQTSDYYARHQADFALPQQTKTSVVVTQNAVDAATAADLLRQNDPPDLIARQPRMRVVGADGYNPDMSILSPALRQQTSDWARSAGIGAVKTFQIGDFYLTLKVTSRLPGETPPLDQIRGRVEREARLALAPSQADELARLYRDAKPSFNSDKYAAYFTVVQQYPISTVAPKKTAETP